MTLSDAVADVGVHGHACQVFETHEQMLGAIVSWIRAGLACNDHCVYIADDETTDRVRHALLDAGVDVASAEASGRLTVMTPHDAYLPTGSFEPDGMIERLGRLTEEARGHGCRALRVAADMSWALGDVIGVERLPEYETKVTLFMSEHECLGLCQYDRRRFDAELLVEIVRTHPLVVYGDAVLGNPLSAPPGEYTDPRPGDGRLDRVLGGLVALDEAERGFRASAQRWETFFQEIGHATMILDPEHRIVAANRAAVAASGRPESDLVGASCYEVFHGKECAPEGCPMEAMRDSKRVETREMEVETLGGTFLISCTPVFDDSGRLSQVIHMATDVTERKTAERALEEDRALLQSVVNGTSDAIYIKDLAGRYLLFNRAAELITGKTADEVLGNDDTFLFPAEEAETVMAGDRAVMEGGVTKTYDEQVTAADGTLHFYLSTKGPLRDLEGRPYGLFGIAHDITDRRKAEEELRASEERYRSLMEQAADGIFITDPDGSYVDVNAAGCAMLGYTREEILGKRISDLVDPADIDAAPLRLEELQQGRMLLAERVLVRKDGSKVPVEINARPLPDGRLQAILHDTTERKAAEAELRALSSRQEAILAAVPDIIAEVDSNKVYTWVNEAGRRFFGDDVVGHEASYYFLGEQETYLRVEPLFHGSSDTVYVESWQRRRDGEKRLLGWWCRALTEEDGSPAGALSTARDITERKAAEDELARHREHLEDLVTARTKELQAMNEKLVEATAAKDEFLAGMSHELRTPLNSIIGFSGVLLSGAAGTLDEEQQKQISMISASGHRLLELVNDLLDIERVESGRVVLVPEVFDPCEVMTEVVESVRPLAEEKDLRLRSGTIEGTGPFFGDRRIVAQVLMNLCANAVKYTDTGAVGVVCRASGDGDLEYEVTDTGPGIPNEDLTGIFDKFVRLRRRGVMIPSGTGLGLALAKRLAMEHGGDVTVRSVVGKGSVFTARFAPCRQQNA